MHCHCALAPVPGEGGVTAGRRVPIGRVCHGIAAMPCVCAALPQIAAPSQATGKIGGVTIGHYPNTRVCAMAWDVCRLWLVLHRHVENKKVLTFDTVSACPCARCAWPVLHASRPASPHAAHFPLHVGAVQLPRRRVQQGPQAERAAAGRGHRAGRRQVSASCAGPFLLPVKLSMCLTRSHRSSPSAPAAPTVQAGAQGDFGGGHAGRQAAGAAQQGPQPSAAGGRGAELAPGPLHAGPSAELSARVLLPLLVLLLPAPPDCRRAPPTPRSSCRLPAAA